MKKYHLGDEGETVTLKGKVSKSSQVVEALGDIDELSSFLGLAKSFSKNRKITKTIEMLQDYLFKIGSEIAGGQVMISDSDVKKIEKEIESYAKHLKEINKFVYPGGSKLASLLHVCRSIARRAERKVWKSKSVSKPSKVIMNRMSDLLFEMARYANKTAKIKERYWP